jgi:hypothetical protein
MGVGCQEQLVLADSKRHQQSRGGVQQVPMATLADSRKPAVQEVIDNDNTARHDPVLNFHEVAHDGMDVVGAVNVDKAEPVIEL